MNLIAIFAAGRVTRWHTHPRLSLTHDPLDGHQGRVARIIMALHPSPSAQLLMAALTHDDGERVTGDIPEGFKSDLKGCDGYGDIAEFEEDARDALWGNVHINVTGENAAWLNIADRIDALMWVGFHAAEELDKTDWQRARGWVFAQGVKLGCIEAVKEMLQEIGCDG